MNQIGVFGMDPGGQTGLAWGVFDVSLGDIGEVLRSRTRTASETVKGSERAQILAITKLWSEFQNDCVLSAHLAPADVWFVAENFIYSPENTYGGDDAKISIALIWGVEGYRMGRQDEWMKHRRGVSRAHRPTMILQTAGQAKSYATNERLHEWGLWVKGREHERSASQHIALFVKRYANQHGHS